MLSLSKSFFIRQGFFCDADGELLKVQDIVFRAYYISKAGTEVVIKSLYDMTVSMI